MCNISSCHSSIWSCQRPLPGMVAAASLRHSRQQAGGRSGLHLPQVWHYNHLCCCLMCMYVLVHAG